jgi:hypothetical protein
MKDFKSTIMKFLHFVFSKAFVIVNISRQQHPGSCIWQKFPDTLPPSSSEIIYNIHILMLHKTSYSKLQLPRSKTIRGERTLYIYTVRHTEKLFWSRLDIIVDITVQEPKCEPTFKTTCFLRNKSCMVFSWSILRLFGSDSPSLFKL